MPRLQLDTPVQFLKGVGPARAKQLAQLGIQTVQDLLFLFPRRFDLRRQAQPVNSLRGDETAATVAGEVSDVRDHPYGRLPYLECMLDDGTGAVWVKWFHGGYLRDTVAAGARIAVSGRTSVYHESIQFVNPTVQVLPESDQVDLSSDQLLPVYPAGAGLSASSIARVVHQALPEMIDLVQPWFGREYLSKRGLMTRRAAIEAMHKPEDREHWGQARRRLAYDECLLMQLGLAIIRNRAVSRPAHPLQVNDRIDQRIRARFPFKLTEAQDQVVSEICADLARPRPMNRLVHGDVGAGKTVVALYAALLAVAHRMQVAIMAPTEILASQHHAKIGQYLAGSAVRAELLTGSTSPAQRERILADLASGSVDVIVGTHALLSEDVNFARLALVVVDEQHKFGVRQRTGLRGKGYAPHYLVMTATPIPRTLAMTVFGDLDVSVIDALPPGRGKTVTRVIDEAGLAGAWPDIRRRLEAAQQAFFIYPLVTESTELVLTAATKALQLLSAGPLAGLKLGLIHGQMSSDEKERTLSLFRQGKIAALVASVVVEVGLDVPSANLMVVMHAERFGLAQLHQLRGRVGRGSEDALCLLVASPTTPQARRRLEVLCETSDGFKVAEEDLRLRGPGELFGTRQHGLPELKVADLIEDFELLRLARRDAFAIVADDPDLAQPEHQTLADEVRRMYGDRLILAAGA